MVERESVNRQEKKDNVSVGNQFNKAPLSGWPHAAAIIQRAKLSPQSLTHADVMQLQKTMGNQAVCQLMASKGLIDRDFRIGQKMEEMSSLFPLQRVELPEEEEEELLQGKFEVAQREAISQEDEEAPLQMKQENNTGLPDNLKSGVESLSGIDISSVRVHYNSDKPAQIGALAYAQGTEIHIAPGREQHLPHEAWHVVQQAQGRVRPTMQLKNVAVNDDAGLEREADIMGEKAAGITEPGTAQFNTINSKAQMVSSTPTIQMEIACSNFDVNHADEIWNTIDSSKGHTIGRHGDLTVDQLIARNIPDATAWVEADEAYASLREFLSPDWGVRNMILTYPASRRFVLETDDAPVKTVRLVQQQKGIIGYIALQGKAKVQVTLVVNVRDVHNRGDDSMVDIITMYPKVLSWHEKPKQL